jgi:hypothetical protein
MLPSMRADDLKLDDRLSGLPNFQRVQRRVLSLLGAEQFRARHPELTALLEQAQSGQSETLDAAKVFGAVRAHLKEDPDLIDRFLIQAARLDLQQAGLQEDYSYLDEATDQGQRVRTKIGACMGLPFRAANFLCHLSNRRRYLYVATPKVACTAIKHTLQQVEMNGTLSYRRYGEEHFPALSPLLAPLDDPQVYFDATRSDDWFRFTFVRNPFSRILSCYLDKIVRHIPERNRLLPELGLDPATGVPSFKEFLNAIGNQPVEQHDFHWALQSWLTRPETMHYHFIGRLERFEADFRHVCDAIGISPDMPAVRHSTNATEQLASFYGVEEIELVRTIYADDFARFDYDSRKLFPD